MRQFQHVPHPNAGHLRPFGDGARLGFFIDDLQTALDGNAVERCIHKWLAVGGRVGAVWVEREPVRPLDKTTKGSKA
jgi:hypothetical protein